VSFLTRFCDIACIRMERRLFNETDIKPTGNRQGFDGKATEWGGGEIRIRLVVGVGLAHRR
jgi:hypothetical protein